MVHAQRQIASSACLRLAAWPLAHARAAAARGPVAHQIPSASRSASKAAGASSAGTVNSRPGPPFSACTTLLLLMKGVQPGRAAQART